MQRDRARDQRKFEIAFPIRTHCVAPLVLRLGCGLRAGRGLVQPRRDLLAATGRYAMRMAMACTGGRSALGLGAGTGLPEGEEPRAAPSPVPVMARAIADRLG
jgi:hypothetical protein